MLPSMAQALKLVWAFSWRSLMAAKLLYSAIGLGHLLQVGRDLNDVPQAIAVMGVIVVVGLTVDRLVFGPRRVVGARCASHRRSLRSRALSIERDRAG